jgi:hypothetical protein
MRYKVQNRGTAAALANYWARFNIECDVEDKGMFVEITGRLPKVSDDTAKAAFDLWREVCDAFVAGRMSMAG